eukprot:COSAG01_NODE_2966_length_6790_cov_15.092662_9_plen_253_part_00
MQMMPVWSGRRNALASWVYYDTTLTLKISIRPRTTPLLPMPFKESGTATPRGTSAATSRRTGSTHEHASAPDAHCCGVAAMQCTVVHVAHTFKLPPIEVTLRHSIPAQCHHHSRPAAPETPPNQATERTRSAAHQRRGCSPSARSDTASHSHSLHSHGLQSHSHSHHSHSHHSRQPANAHLPGFAVASAQGLRTTRALQHLVWMLLCGATAQTPLPPRHHGRRAKATGERGSSCALGSLSAVGWGWGGRRRR